MSEIRAFMLTSLHFEYMFSADLYMQINFKKKMHIKCIFKISKSFSKRSNEKVTSLWEKKI